MSKKVRPPPTPQVSPVDVVNPEYHIQLEVKRIDAESPKQELVVEYSRESMQLSIRLP